MIRSIGLVFFALVSLNIWAQDNVRKDKLTTLHVIIGDEPKEVEQWVYWFSLSGNNRALVDSCYITKGQSTIDMQGYLESEDVNLSTLFFSKKGPDAFKLYLRSGENAKVNMKTYEFEGTPTTSDFFNQLMQRTNANMQKNRLEATLRNVSEGNHHKELSDSIQYYKYQLEQGLYRDGFRDGKTPFFCNISLLCLKEFLSDKEIVEHTQELKKRFPHSKYIQNYPDVNNQPEREQSKQVRLRIDQLNAQKKGIPLVTTLSKPQKEDLEKELAEITPYSLGDRIDSLSEKGLSGDLVSLSEITTPYVLIDFWAGWCMPCLREFPNVKKVLELYGDQLTVYAISLDNTDTDWQRNIDSKELGMFTNVRTGGWDTRTGRIISKRFGIKSIPANFLLDKDKRIIAINLRGEALEKKMKELTK